MSPSQHKSALQPASELSHLECPSSAAHPLLLNRVTTLYIWVHPEYGRAKGNYWDEQLFNAIAADDRCAVVEAPYYHPRTRERVEMCNMRKFDDWGWENLRESFEYSQSVKRLLGPRHIFLGDETLPFRIRGSLAAWSDGDIELIKTLLNVEWKTSKTTCGRYLFDTIVCFGYEQFNCVWGQFHSAGLGLLTRSMAMSGATGPAPEYLKKRSTLLCSDLLWWDRTAENYKELLKEHEKYSGMLAQI